MKNETQNSKRRGISPGLGGSYMRVREAGGSGVTPVKSLDELRKIREQSKAGTKLRLTGESDDRVTISVGMATCGIAAGARAVMGALIDSVNENNLEHVAVVATGCLGYCYAEPLVIVTSPGEKPVHYANADEDLARKIIERHVMGGEIIGDSQLIAEGLQ